MKTFIKKAKSNSPSTQRKQFRSSDNLSLNTAISGQALAQNIEKPEKRSIEFSLGDFKIKASSTIGSNKMKRGLTQAIVNASNKSKYFRMMKKDNEDLNRSYTFNRKVQFIIDFIVNILSNVLNLCAVFIYIIQTIIPAYYEYFELVEFILSIYFLAEYIFLFIISSSKKSYIFQSMTVVELITIAPPIITFIGKFDVKLPFLSVLRIFRMLRMLRIYKSIKLIMNVKAQNQEEDEQLIYNPINMQIIHSLIVLACNIFICAGMFLIINDLYEDSFACSTPNVTFIEAFYFIIITSTTIGFGDITPTNAFGRCFTIILLFYMVFVVGNQISKIAELISIWGDGVFIYSQSKHIIVLCDISIDLAMFMAEIRKDHKDVDIIIVTNNQNFNNSQEYPFNKSKTLYSEEITFDVLNRINISGAKVAFLLGGKKVFGNGSSEKLLDLVIMKINKICDSIPIFTQTLFNEKVLTHESTILTLNKNATIKSSGKKISKVVPIMKLKCMMLTKAYYNPGFLTFSQNLLLSNSDTTTEKYWEKSHQSIIKSYLFGSENKIQVEQIPLFYAGTEFFDTVYNIYFRSIKNIFTKIRTVDNIDLEDNLPILLIGVINNNLIETDEDPYIFNPPDLKIKHDMLGMFICNSKPGYLKQFLEGISRLKNEVREDMIKNECSYLRRKAQIYQSPRASTKDLNFKKENELLLKRFDRGERKNTKRVSYGDFQDIRSRFKKSDAEASNSKLKTEKFQLKAFKAGINRMDSNKPYEGINPPSSQGQSAASSTYLVPIKKFESKLVIGILERDIKDKQEEGKDQNISRPRVPRVEFNIPSKLPSRKIKEYERCSSTASMMQINEIKEFDQDVMNSPSQEVPYRSPREKQPAEETANSFAKKAMFSIKKKIKGKTETFDDIAEDTKLNMKLIDKVEGKDRFDVSIEINKQCLNVFLNTYYDFGEPLHDSSMLSESRIIKLDGNPRINITNHFLIIGKQEGLARIIKLVLNTYNCIQICIFLSPEDSDITAIKLLNAFPQILIFIGDYQNPFHLLCLNLNEATMVLFLTEKVDENTKEDFTKILSFKAVDYFFDSPFILELWNRKSVKWIGYQPLDRNANVITNEFLHPLYMAGKLIYVDLFDKLPAIYYSYEKEYEAWIRLMCLGYTSTNNSFGFQSRINAYKKAAFPAIVSFDLPDYYENKVYHTLVADLLALDLPAIPLGIFVEEPLLYMTMKNEGGVSVDNNKEVGVFASSKNKLRGNNKLSSLQQKFFKSQKLLEKISNTKKVVMDVIDIERTYFPLFITNPPPEFKLIGKIKVQVLCTFKMNTQDPNFEKKLEEIRSKRFSKNILPIVNAMTPQNLKKDHDEKGKRRFNIMKGEDKMDLLISLLKKSTHSQYQKAYEQLEEEFN